MGKIKKPVRVIKISERRALAMKERERRKKSRKLTGKVGLRAGDLFEERKVKFMPRPYKKLPVYSQRRKVMFNNDCNLLSHFGLMRQYIHYKYDVDLQLLEILLYLYDIQYFTRQDYKEFPFNFTHARLNDMVKWGHFVRISEVKQGYSIYSLSLRSQKVIRHFYRLLSGESTIPEEELKKPWKGSEVAIDKKRRDLIAKLTSLPASESKKKLYD